MQAFRTIPRCAAGVRAFSTTVPRPLAKMQLIGRLADQPEHQDTSTGRDIVRFALGVSTGAKDESGNRGVSWFRVASFLNDGPQKDLLLSQVKGTQIYIEADAKMDTYQVDGQNRSQLNLVMRNFELLSRPQSARDGAESNTDQVQEPLSGVGAS